MAVFSDLDGLAVQRIVHFLEVCELARAACASHDLSTFCAAETEARARARIKLSWYGSTDLSAQEACNELLPEVEKPGYCVERPYSTSDLLALAAQYAGGWGRLLARRDGAAISVQQTPVAGPVPTVDACLVMWDIVMNGQEKAVWSGLGPLIDELGVAYRTNVTDMSGNPIECDICNLVPFGSPGSQGQAPWWDTRELVGPHYDPSDCVISTNLDELAGTGVRHRVSLLTPGGEKPVYLSLEMSRYFKPCFDAVTAPGFHDVGGYSAGMQQHARRLKIFMRLQILMGQAGGSRPVASFAISTRPAPQRAQFQVPSTFVCRTISSFSAVIPALSSFRGSTCQLERCVT